MVVISDHSPIFISCTKQYSYNVYKKRKPWMCDRRTTDAFVFFILGLKSAFRQWVTKVARTDRQTMCDINKVIKTSCLQLSGKLKAAGGKVMSAIRSS